MINILLILGIFLLIMALVFALPFFGTGMFTGGIGDIIFDIPIAFMLAIVGLFFIIVGGALQFILDFWWLLLIGLIVFVVLTSWKGWKAFKNRGRRKKR